MQAENKYFKFSREWQQQLFFDDGYQDTLLFQNVLTRLENQNLTVLFSMDKNYNILYTIKQSRNEEKPFLIITPTSNIKRSLQLLLNWLSERQILMSKNRRG